MTVDFKHPEFCTGFDPVSCTVGGKVFSEYNWRDILISLTEEFLQNKLKAKKLYYKSLCSGGEREFILKEKPKFSSQRLSNGCWINVNLSIKDLVATIGRLCEFCGVDLSDVDIKYVTKHSAEGVQQMNIPYNFAPSVPDSVIDVLKKNYASGFRFDTTYFNLLSSASGVEVDKNMHMALKRIMFHRNDDIYFLFDVVADNATRKDIIDFADLYLEEYGCFEIPEFYKLYKEQINSNCIRNAEDFESFYEQIGRRDVRCVQAPNIGHRIARYSNGAVWSNFKDVADKIFNVITDEYYGSCNEDDLHSRFCAFSTDLLGKIIKQCAADKLIRVEINGSICYQTFDALGLPEDFAEILTEVLDQLNDIGLSPTEDVLHTTLSLKLGVNFREEYNLPDGDTYRRLITSFYTSEPRREWKHGVFGEVEN